MMRLALTICILVVIFFGSSCSRTTTVSVSPQPEIPLVKPGPNPTLVAVSFLENRVKDDPDDFVALNKLASYYLKLHRETEKVKFLEQALATAKASLRAMPADQNLGGLSMLAQAELSTHNFALARDLAQELTEYQPNKSFGYQLLGDALVELGDYEKAAATYQRMEQLDPGSVATEARLAHLDLLRGDFTRAQQRYESALVQAQRASIPSDDTVAWCHWQLGEVAFASGKAEEATRHYQNAIAVVPKYAHAVTSLARLKAAQGDLKTAIELFESVVGEEPDPHDAISLGDIYYLAGRRSDAERLFKIAERISLTDALHKKLYGRHLALFWADHDLKLQQAYALAKQDYEVRKDVFAADTLAWTALKAGKINEAQEAMKQALRLGTKDAKLLFHQGMIARAAGDGPTAEDLMRRALKLNPHFDPRQSPIARTMIQQ
jgi:tetratricopeptide (TPR) repeat protein